MTIESLDALIWAEIDRKKNPHNPQGHKEIPQQFHYLWKLKWQELMAQLLSKPYDTY